ncbi:hypothetical protein [Gracilinema caldarium]|uniref:hypothetical protein n=1 Tax=Gracilinema caldarium TaxID=215591 RepID=UPI0026EF9A7A|nr:hypothetical protein [Gracilinema caldarium]
MQGIVASPASLCKLDKLLSQQEVLARPVTTRPYPTHIKAQKKAARHKTGQPFINVY